MRALITTFVFSLVAVGCVLQSPEYDGTEFACTEPEVSCPDEHTCVDGVCRASTEPEPEPERPSSPDAAPLPSPDAAPSPPDSGLGPLTTVVLTGAVADTFIHAGNPDGTYGARSFVRVDADTARVGLVRFDLAALPADAFIESAHVLVRVSESLESGEIVGHRMLQDWSESEATWNQRKNGIPWTVSGAGVGAYDPAPLFTFAPRDVGAYTIELPVGVVQAWLEQVAPNYGLRWMSNSVDGHGADFESNDASATDPGPQLRVQYRTPSS